MSRKDSPTWEIGFFESILKRDPAYSEVVEILGGLYTKTGRVADGLRMDRKLVRLQPRNATAHYNLGCSLALSNRPTDALRSLARAIELGYSDYNWMAEDPDLQSLQGVPAFEALLDRLRTAT